MVVCCAADTVAPLGSVTMRATLAAALGPWLVNVAVKVPVGWPALRVVGPLRATLTSAVAPTVDVVVAALFAVRPSSGVVVLTILVVAIEPVVVAVAGAV